MGGCSRRRLPIAFATRSASRRWRSGNITEPDHLNSIIAAGRADLCALARPHLSEPHFALRAAAALGYTEQWWPQQYLAGKAQIERLVRRADTDYSGVI